MENEKLTFYKVVLSNVRYDFQLFENELIKAMRRIEPEDLNEFKDWCLQTFPKYQDVILENYVGFSKGYYYRIQNPSYFPFPTHNLD